MAVRMSKFCKFLFDRRISDERNELATTLTGVRWRRNCRWRSSLTVRSDYSVNRQSWKLWQWPRSLRDLEFRPEPFEWLDRSTGVDIDCLHVGHFPTRLDPCDGPNIVLRFWTESFHCTPRRRRRRSNEMQSCFRQSRLLVRQYEYKMKGWIICTSAWLFMSCHHSKSCSLSLLTYIDQFHITCASFVGDTRQMRITFLAVFAHHSAVIMRILSKKLLRIAVRIDVDLRQSVVHAGIGASIVDTCFQPRQE